jgi:hypothetical protein
MTLPPPMDNHRHRYPIKLFRSFRTQKSLSGNIELRSFAAWKDGIPKNGMYIVLVLEHTLPVNVHGIVMCL